MELTILEGTTFCICDERGDVGGGTTGFFAEDTRFLSILRLTVDGLAPLLLSSDKVEYFSAAFFLRNAPTRRLPQNTLSVQRRRFVGAAMQDTLLVRNESAAPLSFDVALEIGSDFADILTVKAHDFALGDPLHAPALPQLVVPTFDGAANQFLLVDPESGVSTQVILDREGRVQGPLIRFEVELGPREHWELRLDVVPSPRGDVVQPAAVERQFGQELVHIRDSLTAWNLRVPQLRAEWDDLERAFRQSIADLAALRIRSEENGRPGRLTAAGMPWFMTVFGRDTLLTGYQTLLLGPELARSALEELAELQATEDDASIDAEPGKIVHEVRRGKAAKTWFSRYYGTVDATPLYLVLASEVWRWTDDAGLATALREPIMRALEWVDRYGDRDGDGFVEYCKRSPRGLDNQSWKDSDDSQRFRDGRLAVPPIAPCEVQGYVYDAKQRIAEMAREAWRDRVLALRLESEAKQLFQRFNEAFWIEERGGYYALALDRDKQPVDAMCSNMGHLLWSGIVPSERVNAVVDALMGESMWSGWGIRTMSAEDVGYNPLSYHNGTVWPHDNSLAAAGLARYGRWPEAQRIAQRTLEAARHFRHQLPEVFAGLPRAETPFPIAYPTAARPQAWAAGTPILLLTVLLGLVPDRTRHALTTTAPLELPSWVGSLRLTGVRAFDRRWTVRVDEGRVRVEPE
ncbi:MAG TPA: glycogen debranching N-terminal domain-containing protein [Gaiellaceae bacterium]|nr:glycogen debranching N-terminal domain-containing protein [Gaiellaceae bacterium]